MRDVSLDVLRPMCETLIFSGTIRARHSPPAPAEEGRYGIGTNLGMERDQIVGRALSVGRAEDSEHE
jgi:hypothetical protein